MNITASKEQYLATIYTLNSYNGVRITDIANFLNVKKSSTNSALNYLKDEGLITYEKYKNVFLTDAGLAMARHIVKRNDLFKKFLIEILETDEELAETEAQQLSHCVSCHTTAKLENFIESIFKKEE